MLDKFPGSGSASSSDVPMAGAPMPAGANDDTQVPEEQVMEGIAAKSRATADVVDVGGDSEKEDPEQNPPVSCHQIKFSWGTLNGNTIYIYTHMCNIHIYIYIFMHAYLLYYIYICIYILHTSRIV